MEQKPGQPKTETQRREERLKAALKANLARRKAQSRAKQAQDAGDSGQGSGPKEKE